MTDRSIGLSALWVSLALGCAACGNSLSSEEQARRAYLGLDQAVEKSLKLGFDGFNAASSANIPTQTTSGAATGTLTITGQVDQGASANKGMRLRVGMTDYSDGEIAIEGEDPIQITYSTAENVEAQPELNLSLRDIPNGTMTGTLLGEFTSTGDVEDTLLLNLSFSGAIESDGSGGTRRVDGSTKVTGTATSSGGGEYAIDVTL